MVSPFLLKKGAAKYTLGYKKSVINTFINTKIKILYKLVYTTVDKCGYKSSMLGIKETSLVLILAKFLFVYTSLYK